MTEELRDMFGRQVRPAYQDRHVVRGVPQPPPEPMPPVEGHAMTKRTVRPSGVSRANYYAAAIHQHVCECGRIFESSDMRVAQNLADMHLADTYLPERITRSEAEKPARINRAQRIY